MIGITFQAPAAGSVDVARSAVWELRTSPAPWGPQRTPWSWAPGDRSLFIGATDHHSLDPGAEGRETLPDRPNRPRGSDARCVRRG